MPRSGKAESRSAAPQAKFAAVRADIQSVPGHKEGTVFRLDLVRRHQRNRLTGSDHHFRRLAETLPGRIDDNFTDKLCEIFHQVG